MIEIRRIYLEGFLENVTIKQAVEKRPSAAFPSSFVVAAYIQARLWPTHQLVGMARSRSLFVATPLSGFWAPCIWAFLISLKKMSFSTDPKELTT
jgi:hypothetical protein